MNTKQEPTHYLGCAWIGFVEQNKKCVQTQTRVHQQWKPNVNGDEPLTLSNCHHTMQLGKTLLEELC